MCPKDKRPFLLSIRGVLRRLLTLGILIAIFTGFSTFSLAAFLSGCGVMLLGVLIHFYSKGCLTRNEVITTFGPYRFVRHPFYLGNLLIDTGLCIMSNNPLIFLGYFLLFLLGYTATMKSEENLLISIHGDGYRKYAARVPRLLPVRWPAPTDPDANASFSFRKIIKEHELARSLRIIVYPLLFWAAFEAERYFSSGRIREFFTDNFNLNTLLLSVFAAFQVIARYQDIASTRLEKIDLDRFYKLSAMARWILFPAICVGIFFIPVPLVEHHMAWLIAGTALVGIGALVRVVGEILRRGTGKAIFNPVFMGDEIAVSGLALSGLVYWMIPAAVSLFIMGNGFIGLYENKTGKSTRKGNPVLRAFASLVFYGGLATAMFFKCKYMANL